MVASLLLFLPIYGLLYPVPEFPNNLVPYVVLVWILLGVGYLAVMSRRRPEVLETMGKAFD